MVSDLSSILFIKSELHCRRFAPLCNSEISEQVNRALRSRENVKEKDREHIKGNGVPTVITCNPSFKNLSFLIRKNLQLLYADTETKRVFTPAPFISFRSARSLKSFLVRSNDYSVERKVGTSNTFKCVKTLTKLTLLILFKANKRLSDFLSETKGSQCKSDC